jgi:hypothetical protein
MLRTIQTLLRRINMLGDAEARFRFFREFVRAGAHQAPQRVKLNGKEYSLRSAERVGGHVVYTYTYTFDDLEPVLFKFTLA